MPKSRKSWSQKWGDAIRKPDLPHLFTCSKSGKSMVVPSAVEVAEIVGTIPRGRVMTIGELGGLLATRHGVDVCCPLTTGIFSWLLAHASCESEGAPANVPWWRVVKTGGVLNPKFPGAPELQRRLLEGEGVIVSSRGKKLVVREPTAGRAGA